MSDREQFRLAQANEMIRSAGVCLNAATELLRDAERERLIELFRENGYVEIAAAPPGGSSTSSDAVPVNGDGAASDEGQTVAPTFSSPSFAGGLPVEVSS